MPEKGTQNSLRTELAWLKWQAKASLGFEMTKDLRTFGRPLFQYIAFVAELAPYAFVAFDILGSFSHQPDWARIGGYAAVFGSKLLVENAYDAKKF